ncbi:hypothetical protein OsI_33273 [Oryza sativa Indica Group]|uniref:NB-ARC domain-containing protein n=1 Tax=Oryza sativa subsp. indica TaxID=39946 RepID=A2Z6J4_ORYSI|nr:hypothetical protein OsI_33273 [Oryza sativa Indica Group]
MVDSISVLRDGGPAPRRPDLCFTGSHGIPSWEDGGAACGSRWQQATQGGEGSDAPPGRRPWSGRRVPRRSVGAGGPSPTAKRWMREVRELSYDIEDYIDEFCAAPRPGRRANTMARFVCRIGRVKVARLPKRLKRHQQMGKMVSQFRIYVEEAIERHGRYGLDCCDHRRRYVSFGPMLPSRPYGEEDAQLVIDGRVSEFIERLANDEDQKLKVVSVVGSSGIGKTTLAKLLYNRIGGQFDCRAFVRISRKPDMKRVFREMFFQLQRKQPPDDYKELALIDSIREYLQDRRYC